MGEGMEGGAQGGRDEGAGPREGDAGGGDGEGDARAGLLTRIEELEGRLRDGVLVRGYWLDGAWGVGWTLSVLSCFLWPVPRAPRLAFSCTGNRGGAGAIQA